MAVKISDSPSDPLVGKINKAEMDESLRKFKEEVSLTTLKGDYTAIKTTSCFFGKTMLLELLGIDPANVDVTNIKGISIEFGIQPPGPLSCEGTDYSFNLSVLLFATDDNDNVLNKTGHIMLIPGYKASLPNGDGVDCCGSMSGGNIKVPPVHP